MHVTYYIYQLLEPEMNSSERITVDTCITGKKKWLDENLYFLTGILNLN